MRNKKITIYNLIVIIAIFLIILFCCFIVINNTNKQLELKKFVSEMELIQENVNRIRKEYIAWENYNSNEAGNFLAYTQSLGYSNANSASNLYIKEFTQIINELNNENTKYWDMNIDSILSNYCYFNSQNLKQYFGIDTSSIVIVNFYTGNIIAKNGIKDITNKNQIIHRQYDTSIGNKLVTISFNNKLETKVEVVENYGLSQKIKISFNQEENTPNISEVYYYVDENEYKSKCTDFQDYIYMRDDNSVYFVINKSGNYKFIIKDTNYIEYKVAELEVNLCNKPVLLDNMKGIYWDEDGNEILIENEKDPDWYNYSSSKLKMANCKTDDGNYWVWIPRFVYNVADGITNVEYIYEDTLKNTKNKTLTGYKLQDAFEENNISGFWISKFQVNKDYNENISIKPGQTLTVSGLKNAINSIKKYNLNYNIMSEDERNSVLLISNSENIEISNDLIHYAGGGVNPNDYIENTRYSSTGNVYGVYDLITSENELTRESSNGDFGRYRLVIKK